MKKITLLFAFIFSSSIMFGQIYFEDDFSSSTPNSVPNGWTVFDGDGQTPNAAVSEFTSAWIAVDRDGTASGGGNYGGPAGDIAAASTSWYTPAGASNDWLISPAITPTTDSSVTWDAKAQDAGFPDGYELLISTTGATAPGDFGTVLFSIPSESATWQTRTVDLSAYTGQTIYLAWRNNSLDQFVLLVDNVIVEQNPACFDPFDFVLGPNGITSTSADIAWSDNNGAGTVFDIEFGLEGFTPGTGTIINDVAATNYDFTSLMPDTSYQMYITANCTGGNGDSAQVGPIGFLTAYDCTTYTVPFTEVFDNANAFGSCYTTEDVDGDGLSWISQQDLDLDGDTVVETFATNANGAATTPMKNDWLISPAISLTAGTNYEVTTKFNVFSGTPNASLEAFILDAPNSGATQVATLFSNTGIVTQGAFETLETMAYEEINTFSVGMSGDYYIAYRSFGAGESGFVLMFDSNIQESLSIDEFNQNTFTHNYSKDLETLTLESSNLEMTNIEIYSILGQNVISKPLSSTREVIDVASLNDGVYLAKIFADGGSKTIKFVKN